MKRKKQENRMKQCFKRLLDSEENLAPVLLADLIIFPLTPRWGFHPGVGDRLI